MDYNGNNIFRENIKKLEAVEKSENLTKNMIGDKKNKLNLAKLSPKMVAREIMKKVIILISILLAFIPSIYSQNTSNELGPITDQNKNVIYLELMGNNGLYSINYERTLYIKQDHTENLALSVGLNFSFSIFQTKIPIELKYIWGQKHAFELGAGLTLGTANWFDELEPDKWVGSYFVLRAGYRYSKKGLLIRVAPMVHIPKYWSSAIWGGVSVGYSF